MTVQEIIVAILFTVAAVYLGRALYRSFRPKNGCGSNCGCSGQDVLKRNTTTR